MFDEKVPNPNTELKKKTKTLIYKRLMKYIGEKPSIPSRLLKKKTKRLVNTKLPHLEGTKKEN